MDRLFIDGFSGAISKMLMVPGRDLYDIDDCIEEDFGDIVLEDEYICHQQEQQQQHHQHTGAGNCRDVKTVGSSSASDTYGDSSPTIRTTATYDTVDLESNSSGDPIGSKPVSKECPALDSRTDPFAPRPGKTLVWRNVNMVLSSKKKKNKDQPDRHLLKDVWGEVPETETTAIMGASGAGKTSLLNILSGRVSSSGRIKIEADVRLNNSPVDPTNIKVRQNIAFVAQDDSLQATSTPRECIWFSAKLRLPKTTSDEQLNQLVTRMLEELGLTKCADTYVGGPLLKGISGGERKRASIGVELVVQPSMVFLDEPTSGLDAFSAVQVCQVLKKVATAGASVLFTIHQPSSEIFQSFDRLILMQSGHVMFQGPVSIIPDHFARLGYPIPSTFNPPDWIINVAQSNTLDDLKQKGFFTTNSDDSTHNNDRVLVGDGGGHDSRSIDSSTWMAMTDDADTTNGNPNDNDSDKEPAIECHGWTVQTYLLVIREFHFFYRFPLPVQTRMGFSTLLATLVGFVGYEVGLLDPANEFNISSIFGALMILMVFAMISCAQPAIMYFPEERPIFVREYSTNHYGCLPYFISRLLVETILTFVQLLIISTIMWNMVKFQGRFWIIFLCSFTLAMSSTAIAVSIGIVSRGNSKVATQLLPVVLLPQFLFSGFFVSPSVITPALRWVHYVCPLTYGVRIIAVEEFYNCSDEYFASMNCNLLLDSIGANPENTTTDWIVLVTLFVIFRLVALFLLKLGASKYY